MDFGTRDFGPGSDPAPRPPRAADAIPAPVRDADSGKAIPDSLVDAFFDNELPAEKTGEFFNLLRREPAKAREVVGMQRALSALRQPVDAPDLSAAILAKVGRKRGWLSDRGRVRIAVGRVAMAATLLLMVGGAFVAQRVAPGLTTAGFAPAPIDDLARAVPTETASAGRTFATAVESLGAAVQAAPVLNVVARVECDHKAEVQVVRAAAVACRSTVSHQRPPSTAWVADVTPASAAVVARVAQVEFSKPPATARTRRAVVSTTFNAGDWSADAGLGSLAVPASLTRQGRDPLGAEAAIILPGR